MPSVRGQFDSFRAFASASLDDIYGDKLKDAYYVTANHVESGVWMNRLGENGEIHYEWKSFPRFAQISPIYGMQVNDFNGDGYPDIYALQNSYSTQPETGWWRGGLSQLLYGQGDGTFKCVSTKESGLLVADDAKALALVDLNNDNQVEIVATQNNGSTKIFKSSDSGVKSYAIKLRNDSANASSTGARLVIKHKSGKVSHREIKTTSGYLTQQPAVVYMPIKDKITSIAVRWPDGSESNHATTKSDLHIELSQ